MVAASEGDYTRAVHSLGRAALSSTGSGVGEKIAPGRLGKGPLRIGKVTPPKDAPPKTVVFGNEMHERIGSMFKQRIHDPQKAIVYRLKPGQRGVDIEAPQRLHRRFGFRYAEIKSQNPVGAASLQKQIEKWGFASQDVLPITYRYSGTIFIGF